MPVLTIAVLAVVAWGAFAFGGVYPWAYVPLALAGAAIGGVCLLQPTANTSNRGRSVALALGLLVVAIALQLVPLSVHTLHAITPTTDQVLRQYDVLYGVAGRGQGTYHHAVSVNPDQTRTALLLTIAFGLLLAGLPRRLSRNMVERLALGLVIVGTTLALVGMIQSALHLKEIYGSWRPLEGGQPFGPFVNRNHFAGWMAMAIPVGLGYLCALIERGMRNVGSSWRKRVLWLSTPPASRAVLIGLGVLLMGTSLMLTLSRGGIGGLVVAVGLSGVASLRHQAAGGRRRAYAIYLLFFLVVAIGWAGVDSVAARFASTSNQNINGRLGPWTDAVSIARRFPLTGTGLNTYGVATLFYQEHDLALHFDQAHNDYLQLAAEGGLLLGIPILLLISIVTRKIWTSFDGMPREGRTYWIKVGAVIGILAIALQEVVDFSLQMPGNAVLFVVLCAIAMYAPTSQTERSGYRPARSHRA